MSTDAATLVEDGLKDFQRRTVDHVARRMLDEGARRYR